MTRGTINYFEQRAREEERLSASSTHPAVKATHERFAAAYREQAESEASLYGASGQQQALHAEG